MIETESVTYVGVDISWSVDPAPEGTGLCTIQGEEIVDFSLAKTDHEIVEYSVEREADFVGVDAPLKVTNNEGERSVESELRSLGHSVLPANRDWFEDSYGGIRGEELVEEFNEQGYRLSEDTSNNPAVIEVYPYLAIEATLGRVPTYKNARKDEIYDGLPTLWAETQQRISDVDFNRYEDFIPDSPDEVTKKELKRIGDQIDAFYSGYVLKMDSESQGKTRVFGDLETGSILSVLTYSSS